MINEKFMNCDEFRKEITSGNDLSDDLIKHKLECKDCQDWLQKELSTAPNGLTSEEWNNAVSKCLNINIEESDGNNMKQNETKPANTNEKPESEKSFMDYYLSGLKYGIVFGLAIVVGFAIIQNKNENKNQSINNSIASDTANISSNTVILPIATDSEIIPLPTK